MTPQGIADKLTERFGGKVLEVKADALNPWVRVEAPSVAEIARYLRDDPALAFDSLMCLSGLDWPKTGTQEVVYHLYSFPHRHRIVLKAQVPREAPRLPSVEAVWPAANWHEREAFDLLGIVFEGHSDLRRILLPEDWEGHPLRKDYTIPETYHGLRIMNLPGSTAGLAPEKK